MMSLDKTSIQHMTEKYRDLIFRFTNQQIPVEEFEPDYLRLFKHDKGQVPSLEFDTLEKFFFAVDDYVADPELRQAVRGLDEDQLRDCARDTYRRLYLGIDR